MITIRTLFLTFSVLYFCAALAQNPLKKGMWRAVLTLSEKKNEIILPFNFEVSYIKNKAQLTIHNADEKIKVTDVRTQHDSVFIKMPLFDSEFKTKLLNDTLYGVWINYNKKEKNIISFEAYYNDSRRFITDKNASADFSGKYEVTFDPGKESAYKAIGLFKQSGNKLTGTFLTETGDYRYLEGSVQNNTMALSCFDGSHAFLFFANSAGSHGKADSLSGEAFYGISGTEKWVAVRNDAFELKDPELITYLKNPTEKVYFSFPNLNGQTVSLTDEKFKNKVVIIQLMGTWCPNCMDETAYLAKLYKQYKNKGLEIVGLAYERTDSFEKAKNNVLRSKKKFGADYEFLITGLNGAAKASESMPFLNQVSAFPTTIILDRKHKVKSIYTGFSGPATGKAYEQYQAKTENLLHQLLLKKD